MFDQLFLTLLLLLYCPLFSPGAHTHLSISSTPTLHELGKLSVGHAASQWEEVAPHHVVESFGVCKFGCGHLQEASRGALGRWLKDNSYTNTAEKTMGSGLEAHDSNGHSPLAEQLKLCSGGPVTDHPSSPGTMYVDRICVYCLCLNTMNSSVYLPMVVCPYM